MWRLTVGAYKVFKYTIYFLLILGIGAGLGCPRWCDAQMMEIVEISPFDDPPGY